MSNFLGTNQFSGKTEIQRFWEKVNKQSDKDCWEWIAGKNSKGYGQFRFKDKNWQAHRVSWVLHFGEIPKGLFICHHCDNPSCVNPEHLFIGTASDNANDMAKKEEVQEERNLIHQN